MKFGCGVKFVPTYYTILPYKLPSLFVFIYIVPNKWYLLFLKNTIFLYSRGKYLYSVKCRVISMCPLNTPIQCSVSEAGVGETEASHDSNTQSLLGTVVLYFHNDTFKRYKDSGYGEPDDSHVHEFQSMPFPRSSSADMADITFLNCQMSHARDAKLKGMFALGC